jgi:hypothetical protein
MMFNHEATIQVIVIDHVAVIAILTWSSSKHASRFMIVICKLKPMTSIMHRGHPSFGLSFINN